MATASTSTKATSSMEQRNQGSCTRRVMGEDECYPAFIPILSMLTGAGIQLTAHLTLCGLEKAQPHIQSTIKPLPRAALAALGCGCG